MLDKLQIHLKRLNDSKFLMGSSYVASKRWFKICGNGI